MKKENIFVDPQLRRRHLKSKLFKFSALSSLVLASMFLVWFLLDMSSRAAPAFTNNWIQIEVTYSETTLDNPRKAIDKKYRKIASKAWLRDIGFYIKDHPELLNTTTLTWVLADDQVDQYLKGHNNRLKSKHKKIVDDLLQNGRVDTRFNKLLFVNGDSKHPEYSGLLSAAVGTILTLIVTMVVAFPVGVMTSIYLEEFAPKNRFTEFIEININNLAAIPSILFGLLGLAVFITLFGMPRSSPLVGGLTLALMTLPIIIVSSRAALRGVPDSIREAGYGLGLTKWQTVRDHVLPVAMPGVLTGSIIGLAQAMGETAPLIIVGMIAFIPDSPTSITDAATVLPAQIFTWASMPETAYIERTAAGIMVLLTVLMSLNAIAIYLRKKYEIKW